MIIKQTDSNAYMETQNSQHNIKGEEETWNTDATKLQDLQEVKTTIIKTVSYRWKNEWVHQWNETESPEPDPHKYSQLILDKGAKAIQWAKIVSSIMVLEQLDIHTQKI